MLLLPDSERLLCSSLLLLLRLLLFQLDPHIHFLSWPEYFGVANNTRQMQAYNKVDPALNRNTVQLSAAYKCVYIHCSYTLFA